MARSEVRLPIVGRSGPRNGIARSRPRPITQSMWTGSAVNRSATDNDLSKPYGSLSRGKLNSSATAKSLQFAAMRESGSGAERKLRHVHASVTIGGKADRDSHNQQAEFGSTKSLAAHNSVPICASNEIELRKITSRHVAAVIQYSCFSPSPRR